MNVQARNARTHLIRLIHVARRDLDMADDTYRAIVGQLAAGKASSADCTVPELERIVAHLKQAGFKVRKPKAAQPAEHRPLATDPESKKLRAVWLLLHQIGATHSNTEAALAAYVKRMTGVDDLHFARRPSDKFRAIEGLKAWAARELPAAIAARIARLIAAGIIPAGLEPIHIHHVVAPTLNPRSFDALVYAWQWLDGKERKGAEVFDIHPPARVA
jgi:phage gp16-like protein